MYARVKKPTIVETVSLNRLCWFGHAQRMEGNRIPKRVLFMNLGTTKLRGRPRNRWQHEVREDGRIVGGEGWQEKVHNREEWKKLLRTARNCCILHMPMEWMNHYTPLFSPTLQRQNVNMFTALSAVSITQDLTVEKLKETLVNIWIQWRGCMLETNDNVTVSTQKIIFDRQ